MKLGTIKTLSPAEAATKLDRYAALFVGVQKRNAKLARDMEKLQAAATADNAAGLAEMQEIEALLADFAKSNRVLFEDKRKLKTASATLGLQKASEIVIEDEDAFVAWAKEKGLLDLVKTEEKPVKAACKTRLENGETLPGVTKSEHENINIKVAKHLLADVTAAGEQ